MTLSKKTLVCASALAAVAFLAGPTDGSAREERWADAHRPTITDTHMWGQARLLVAETAPRTSVAETLLAQEDEDLEDDVNDPLEPINRVIFDLNELIYDLLFRPLAYAYNDHVHEHIRYLLGNVFENVSAPVTLANDLLQGEWIRARTTATRVLTNTVFGFAGMVDLAEEFGFEEHSEDFGQTLAVWGAPEGFYVVLPIFGPSSPRRAIGQFLVDKYFSPFHYWASEDEHPRDTVAFSLQLGSGLHRFAGVVDELDDVKKTSIDYYAAVRSLYRQKRNSEIANGETIDLPPIPDLGYELELEIEDVDGGTESGDAGDIDKIDDPFGTVYEKADWGSAVEQAGHGLDALSADAFGQPGDVPLAPAAVEVAETGSLRSKATSGSF